jgi:hypothetical protein
MKNYFKTLVASSLLIGIVSSAKATTVVVADFSEATFAFTYSGGNSATLTGSVGTTLRFDNLLGGPIGGYNPVVGTFIPVTETITANFSLASSDLTNTPIDKLTLSFTGTSGAFAGVNLLTVTTGEATNASAGAGLGGTLSLANNSNSGAINASNDGTSFTAAPYVKYSSSVIDTLEGAGLTEEDLSLSVNSQSLASYSTTPFSGYLNSNVFVITGSLLADVPATTPEPGSVAVATGAMVSLGILRLRRRRK